MIYLYTVLKKGNFKIEYFQKGADEQMEEYKVTGMSCAACSSHVEKAVAKVQGVDNVAVSLLTNSMTVEGKMDWQNALTDKNLAYLKDEEGNSVADKMFVNFAWTSDKLAPEELLKSSSELAKEEEIDPYELYAGIDLQSNGYDTALKWNLFENPEGGTYTSLGLYCPSWTFFSTDIVQDFWKKENKLWVNSKGDPSVNIDPASDTDWRGISTYVVERTAVTSLPFVTNFSTGNGYGFYKKDKNAYKK